MLNVICAALALAAGPPSPPCDTHDIVYLSPKGPVLIRLHVRIDGQSVQGRFDALMDEIFDSLDANRDGRLSKEEAALAPSLGASANIRFLFAARGAPRPTITAPPEG